MKLLYTSVMLALMGCAESSSSEKSGDPKPTEDSSENIVSISGSLVLSGDVAPEDSDELTPGESISGGTVFLKGFPDQTTTAEVDGTFTLAVDVGEMALRQGTSYKVLMWYTTNQSGSRFGAKKEIVIDEPSPYTVGAVKLTYTNAVHFLIKDSVTEESVTADCTFSIDGYGERLPIVDKGNGAFDTSYMPPDDYELLASCEGYKSTKHKFTVDPAEKVDSWMSITVLVEAE